MTAGPLFSEPVEGVVLPPATDEVVTVSCTECGESFTGPAGGKGSAPMLRGRHLWAVHKIRGDGTRADTPSKGKGAKAAAVDPVALATDPHPVAATLAAAGSKVTGTGAPRAEQLARGLGVGVSVVSQGVARWAVRTDPDPTLVGNTDRQDALIAALSLDGEAATKVLAPIARVLAPTQLNRKYGRAVVENTDLGPALMELADLGSVWVQYLASRRALIAELRATREGQFPPAPAPVPTGPPVVVAPAAAPAPATPPPPGPGGVDPILGGGRLATARH